MPHLEINQRALILIQLQLSTITLHGDKQRENSGDSEPANVDYWSKRAALFGGGVLSRAGAAGALMTEIRKVGGLNEVERRLEEALRNFAGQGAANPDRAVTEITAGERIHKIGNLSALAIIEASETTAKDIEEAGQAAVNIANDIMAEAQRLAADLRANGKKMSEHLQEFAKLANKVSTAMRNTRAEVLNGEDPLPRAKVLPGIPDRETIQ